MKKVSVLFVGLAFTVLSCSNHNVGNENAAEATVTHKELSSEVNRTVANLTIEGMTCSAGCGGKIQQDLRALKGVNSTDLDFADARPANIVSVEFDPNQLNEQQLIQCVNGIGDGQYHVTSVEILHYKGLQSSGGSSGGEMKSDHLGRAFQVLNLLQSITRMINQ
jgi:copper chaperone CopZ